MNALDEYLKKLKYILRLVSDDYYISRRQELIDMLKLSRRKFVENSPIHSFELQVEIQKIIEEYEQNVTEGRQSARVEDDDATKQGYMIMADRNKLIAGAYRSIVDGFAWRKLGFDKGVIRILSQGQSPGAGPKDGREAEIRHGRRMARRGGDVLLHDATSYLLVGDLSLVARRNKVPYLIEVKKGKKDVITARSIRDKINKNPNDRLTKQQKKLFEAQLMIFRDQINVGDSIRIVYDRFSKKVKNFHKDVERLMDESRRKGFAAKHLSEYLLVEVIDLRSSKITLDGLKGLSARREGAKYMSFSNLDNLVNKKAGEPVRGIVPYTIFPFSPKDIIDIMMGNLYLHADINIDALEMKFNDLGWVMHIDVPDGAYSEKNDERYGGESLFGSDILNSQYISFTHKDTGFVMKIGFEVLIYIGYEFFTAEAVLAPLERRRREVVKAKKSTRGYMYAINNYEKKFWK